MFLDASYVAKYYVNEPDSPGVRRLIRGADSLVASAWSVVEVASAIRRHLREGRLNAKQFQATLRAFHDDIDAGIWTLIPLNEELIRRASSLMEALPGEVFLRAGDAIQLASSVAAGEHEIWSNDRHLLAAAPHCGLAGRSG